MKHSFLTPIMVLIISVSCGGGGKTSAESVSPDDYTAPVLRVTGEIGIELGDSNYVFGVIQDVDFLSDGTVAVLDSQKKKVRVYTPDGEFLGSFGGVGEAPGELLNPVSLACLPDGRTAVSDPFSREVEIFNRDFSYSETVADFTERAPFVITATENGFAGEQGGFNRDRGTVTQRVVSWDLSSDTVHVLFETETNFSSDNMAARFMEPQAGIVSFYGVVYFAPPVWGSYTVHAFPVDGSAAAPLTFPGYAPVRRTDTEIQNDIQVYEDRLQAMAASGRGHRFTDVKYDPPEYYYATSGLGVDHHGRIWVQRGFEQTPVFDLFIPGESVPVETVTLESQQDFSGFDFVITPYGMAAFERDPEYFPSVVLLELHE